MTPATRIRIAFDDGNEVEMTVAEFSEGNELFPEMIEAACAALDRGETYRDGGGAAPAFTVSLLADQQDEEPDWPDITEMVDAIAASAAALTLATGQTPAANEAIAKARADCLAILNLVEAMRSIDN